MARNRNRVAPEIAAIPLSDKSRLLLRTVYRTLEDNTKAIQLAVDQINANTSRLVSQLARELADRDNVDLGERVLDVDAEQWIPKPAEGPNGKVAP